MKLADFAEHAVTLQGGWNDYHGQRRFLGALACAAPVRVMSLLACGAGHAYTKSGRTDGTAIEIALSDHPIWQGERRQIMLRIGDELNTRGVLDKARGIEIPDRCIFATGMVFDWAAPDALGSPIKLLVIARSDLETRRNGIWRVKPHHAAALPESWRAALTATRHGLVVP